MGRLRIAGRGDRRDRRQPDEILRQRRARRRRLGARHKRNVRARAGDAASLSAGDSTNIRARSDDAAPIKRRRWRAPSRIAPHPFRMTRGHPGSGHPASTHGHPAHQRAAAARRTPGHARGRDAPRRGDGRAAHAARAARRRRARRARAALTRHADLDRAGLGARVRSGPGRRCAGQARLEARNRLAGRLRRALRVGLRARPGHGRTGVARDRRVRPGAARVLGGDLLQAGDRGLALDRERRRSHRQPAQGSRRRAPGCRQRVARGRRRRLRHGAVARHADVPGAVPADGAPDHHHLAVRLHPARERDPLAPGARGIDPGDLVLADRQRGDLDRGRHGRRRQRVRCSDCRSRSCWP